MSSHPGSRLEDAIALAEYLNANGGRMPEQVQDFYPTPGTISTCMYYTEIDPFTMKHIYVPKTPHEKAMQRALLQWRKPENRRLIMQALHETHREDLVGFGPKCLLRPERSFNKDKKKKEEPPKAPEKPKKRGKGWAKPKAKPQKGRGKR